MNHQLGKICFFIVVITSIINVKAQSDTVIINDIDRYQRTLNIEFLDTATSPLNKDDIKNFKGLDFFSIDESFRVTASITVSENSPTFGMESTTSRKPKYRKYGTLLFSLGEKVFNIPVYQNLDLSSKLEFQDYLFLPFTDLTNGESTYSGGRYLDLRIPKGNTIIVDFNKSYNPYCVYNHKYSCPIPPKENFIEFKIQAGVKNYIISK